MQNIRSIQIDRIRSPWRGQARRRIGKSILPLLLLALCFSGCGKKGQKLSPVSGRVTFQGKVVSTGMVRFSNPPAGIDILAPLQPDGSYSVRVSNGSGLPEGTYAVAVVPPRADAPVGAMTPPSLPQCPDIPEKYRQPSTSGLTVTVNSGACTFDVDMLPGK